MLEHGEIFEGRIKKTNNLRRSDVTWSKWWCYTAINNIR